MESLEFGGSFLELNTADAPYALGSVKGQEISGAS